MKVLHVVPSFHPAYVYGGPIQSSYELCSNLSGLGCEVRVLTTDANGLEQVINVETAREVSMPEGFQVRYCHRRLRHSVSPRLATLLSSYVAWADVVHLTGVYNFPTFPTVLMCRRAGKPLIWSPRGALQRWEKSRRRGLKGLWDFSWYHLADRPKLTLHFTAEEEARESLARLANLQAAVIPNGVAVPSLLNRSQSNGRLRLLFIGRLDPKKGIEALLRACRLLKGEGQAKWHLTIAGWGDPAYVDLLQHDVTRLGLEQDVSMVGKVLAEAKKRLFESSDVLIVPSHTENFAIVVAEALAHGVPAIASKGTPWSALEDKQCGLWVENDPESLHRAICKIREMPLVEMGQRGRDWMQAEFSWASVTKTMLDLYSDVLSRSSQA
jgi:glycosyltransferase involved in cell wall biosynthesis